ncbi:MAG: carbohydrate ABC transporter permease [Eubacteriales bacterium]|nr:carbohydrate ABC transporter permease [Eubacteriales bacterium]
MKTPKKQETFKIKGDRGLRITAWVVTLVAMVFILFPFFMTISNAMKDNVKIYDVPPRLIPESANSLSIVVDYDTQNATEETMRNDMLKAFYGVYTKLTRESIFEIKFYGMHENQVVFFARSHQTQLQMEKDYGIYKGMVLNEKTLLYKDRPARAATKLGYSFNIEGLPNTQAPKSEGKNVDDLVLPVFEGKFPLTGVPSRFVLSKNSLLLLENFVHYMKLPQYMYAQSNPTIAKYGFWTFSGNTVIVIGFAMVSQLLLCSICGFVISRLLPPKQAKFVLLFFLGGMMIPFVSIMIPQLIMYKSMGAYNNYAALLLPFLYPFGFYVYLYKGFFDRIPGSYFEAAKLDGASNFYLYTHICMPLSKPIIALVALQTFLGNWNDFFWAWLVTERQDLWTLNVALFNISNNTGTKQNAMMGIAFITILPVLIVALLFSKQLKASIISSGVKG